MLQPVVAFLLLFAAVAVPVGRTGAQPAPDLAGVWRGHLVNLPARPDAAAVEVTVELGALPTTDSTCVPWKTTYREGGTVRAVKDYRLCRAAGAGALYVDEGDGVTLKATLLGDVLVSTFKAGAILLVTHLRVRGDTLTEEIITAMDRPATDGVVSLESRGIQRVVLVRQRPGQRQDRR